MAFNEIEKQIMIQGKLRGKSATEIEQKIADYRTGKAGKKPATKSAEIQPSGFIETLKDAPSDIISGAKKAGERFLQTGEEIVDIAQRKDRSLAEKATMIGGKAFGGGAGAIGELTLGAAKAVVSPDTEEKVKSTLLSGVESVMANGTVQDAVKYVTDKYNALPPDAQEQVDAAGGFASALLEIIGAKGAGRATSTGKRLVTEGVEAGLETGKDALRTVKTGASELVSGIAESPVVGGTLQKGKELLERVPRAGQRAKEATQEAFIRSEKIKNATPAVKEAIKVNLDDAVISTVQEADAPTLKAYKEMLDISSNPKKTLGVKTRPEIVAGRAAESQYQIINKQRKTVGKQIGEAVDELSKTTKVDMSDGYKAIDDTLGGEGISVSYTKKGPVLDFKGSRFTPAERTKIQELYRLATEVGGELTPSQIYKRDNLFSKLQREARFEGVGDIIVSTPDGDKSLFSVFRDVFSKKLDDVSPTKIRELNKQYAKLRNLQDDIEDSIVKTGNFDASKTTDLAEFAQTNLRRLGSDAQSAAAYREIAGKMDTIARELGYKGAKPETLIDFANEMRRLFPDVIPATSFQGGIKTSLAGMAEKVLNAGTANLTDQQKALRAMIEELINSGAIN